jgi:hypothetical protein
MAARQAPNAVPNGLRISAEPRNVVSVPIRVITLRFSVDGNGTTGYCMAEKLIRSFGDPL